MTAATLPTVAAAGATEENPWARAWRRLKRRKGAMAALVVVVFLILIALLAPWIAPYDPTKTSFGLVRKAPTWAHWFGTDEVGRDILSRVLHGARVSLGVAIPSVALAVVGGTTVGVSLGYWGGAPELASEWFDRTVAAL